MRRIHSLQNHALRSRAGFTAVELMLAVAVIGLLALTGLPKLQGLITRSRINRSAAVVASDLEAAFAMAGRQRKPVRVACACDSLLYRITDRQGGTLRLVRVLGGNGGEFGVVTLGFSTPQVDVFPSGVASAPLTVTLGAGGYTRQVTMTTAGHVRILPP